MKRMSNPGLWAFTFGLAGGLLGGWLSRRNGPPEPVLPDERAWKRELVRRHGEVRAAVWLARTRARFVELVHSGPHFDAPALRQHLETNIFPVLALYKTVRAAGLERSAALAEIEPVIEAGMKERPTFGLARLTRYLPAPFEALRAYLPIAMRRFPPQGWAIEQLENQPDHVSFNISRCFYVDVLAAYGAPELCPLFCRADDLLMAEASPQIKWARTSTLAEGAERCDFRWERVAPQPLATELEMPVPEAV